ncbi:NupC/NupG family nucleoside CNT transporter [candidate division KSB1 bacterium]|nr:NupC/NupG family nucleoside CNT transporter [candidate division KSB1 bacterium]
MFIFSSIIVLYLFSEKYDLHSLNNRSLGLSVIIILLAATATGLCYFLDKIGISLILFILLALVWLILLLLKKRQIVNYVFSVLMITSLGIIFQRRILGKDIFAALANKVDQFLKITDVGSQFLFGKLADPAHFGEFGYQFAFSILPTIIFFSAFMSILYYFGIMQALVKMMAKFMRWTLGTSGAETLTCSANVFVGPTEAPLLIRPFINEMTISELHAVMVGGFATIAGGVMAGYIRMGINPAHLIAASVMSAPAALAFAKIMLPETEHTKSAGDVEIPDVGRAANLLDATTKGVTDGLKLAVNVGAMLIAFIALIALIDKVFSFLDVQIDGRLLGRPFNSITEEYAGFFPGSLKRLFGFVFAPIAFIMGVPWKDALTVGNLLGIKIAVNEFVGYAELGKLIKAEVLTPKAVIIASYALCGFANFSSIGIQIGGIGALAPNRRADLSKIALRAMIAGALASWMTATIAGLLL